MSQDQLVGVIAEKTVKGRPVRVVLVLEPGTLRPHALGEVRKYPARPLYHLRAVPKACRPRSAGAHAGGVPGTGDGTRAGQRPVCRLAGTAGRACLVPCRLVGQSQGGAMREKEARSLKVGDKLHYAIGDGSPIGSGVVTELNWACFKVLWEDGLSSIVNFNEAHNIVKAPKS